MSDENSLDVEAQLLELAHRLPAYKELLRACAAAYRALKEPAEPVQAAPSEESLAVLEDFIHASDSGPVRKEAARQSIAALRAQLAAAPQLQLYLDEECRLRREAETRAEKAEAQLAERTKEAGAIDVLLWSVGRIEGVETERVLRSRHRSILDTGVATVCDTAGNVLERRTIDAGIADKGGAHA